MDARNTRTANLPNAPWSRPRGALHALRLWLAAPALLLLSVGWCGLNMSQFDLLRKTPMLDTDDAEERQKERNKPKTFRMGGDNAVATRRFDPNFQLCQAGAPMGGPPACAVDCGFGGACGAGWNGALPIDFQPYGPGEYVGHPRLAHVPAYRLRVDDQLECLYRLTREETSEPYEINVGDELQIEMANDEGNKLKRNLIVQPDGTITLPMIGQVKATGTSVADLRDKLETLYSKYYTPPGVTLTPLKVNTRLEDLRATVDNRSGVEGGQGVRVRITPEGTISLPAIGTVPAQGLTLEELKVEIDLRYAATISGIEVTPVLAQRAPRFCYVLGEVRVPNRYVLEAPTTVMQAIALAGSWNVGANLRQVVIFRRGDDWRLLATMVNLEGAMLYANQPCPGGEIWLNDSDVIILPKGRILLCDDFINLVFTRGIYGILPFGASYSWSAATIR
ncbi:MAG: polysaccharide biosynthesis/export family protein [Pirellulales bacterium]